MPERRFIRHPVEVPIEIEVARARDWRQERLRNVGAGGLCFHAKDPLDSATRVRIRIPAVDPSFEVEGWVVWCNPADRGFDIGVEVSQGADDYRLRMVEQLSHIENYRRLVEKRDGRRISAEQAAREWITRYADEFAHGAGSIQAPDTPDE
jgi:hypothetical protein